MKKAILASLVLASGASAFAADSLIAGFNFGQFNGSGVPSTDGVDFLPAGSIAAGFRGTSTPTNADSGVYRANNSIPGAYDPGYATWYWDGTNGSDAFAYNGIAVAVVEGGLNAVNSATVHGGDILGFDTNFAGLSFAVSGQKWSIVTSTVGFVDTATAGNFTFAAYSSAGATVEWFLDGSSTAFATSTVTAGTEYNAYTVDLPSEFYGQGSVSIQGRLSSGSSVTFDNAQINGGVSAVPEPSSFAALAGLAGLALAASRRRRAA